MSLDLSEREVHFIILLRNFDFLRSHNYSPSKFALYGRYTFLRYENKKLRQAIYIEWSPKNYLKILLIKKSLFRVGEVELKSLYKYFDKNSQSKESPPIYIDMPEIIEYNVKFIQQHLMPVIKGEMWIDELIR